jgi:outer membrane protein insertion porin family/translocation and assembly module TamA
VGYIEPKGAIGVDRRFGRHFFAKLSQNVQGEVPHPYKGPLDSSLPGVLFSFPQLTTTLDYRNDVIHPHSGVYVSNDLQAAGFGGSAQDLRVQPEVRGYVPIAKGVTLAARGSVGLLYAFNYGQTVQSGAQVPADDPATNRDIELTYFRGFFSGGPASNRGYPLRGIAPHGFVPFLIPTTVNPVTGRTQSSVDCTLPSNRADPACSVPIGGFTLWEASVELRADVSGPFAVATFCDAGDVSPQEVDIRLSHLHLSCGAGLRYGTPVGPIRLDVGYRIQPLQVLGYATETDAAAADPAEGTQPMIFYLPLAVALGLGEAF